MARFEAERAVPATAPARWTAFRELPGTTLRFATLILLILVTTAMIYRDFGSSWHWNLGDHADACAVSSGYDGYDQVQVGYQSAAQVAAQARFDACNRHFASLPLWFAAGGAAAVLVLATVLYCLQPRWMIWRNRMTRLGQGPGSHDLGVELAALARTAGLDGPPRFFIDPMGRYADGRAFGGRRFRAVGLNAPLTAQYRRDPAAFRAVVLHELAHLRNRDVGMTYATIALWRAFVIVTIVPCVLEQLDPFPLSTTPWASPFDVRGAMSWAGISAQLYTAAIWTVLILLSYFSILRAREFSADACAAAWTGGAAATGPWIPESDPAHRRRLGWWSKHPTLAARRHALREPHRAVRPGWWEMFAGSTALALAWWYAVSATSQFDPSLTGFTNLAETWTVLGLLAGLATIGVRRAVAYRRESGRGRFVFVRVGAGLALGQIAGLFLTEMLISGFGRQPLSPSPVSAVALGSDLVLVLTGVAVCYAAGTFLEPPTAPGSRAYLAATFAVLLLCVCCLKWWLYLPGFYGLPAFLTGTPHLLHGYAVQSGLGTWGTVAIAAEAYPYIVYHMYMTAGLIAVALIWLPNVLLGHLPRAQMRRAASGAGFGAAAWLLLDVLLRVWAAHAVAPRTRATDGFLLAFADTQILAAVAVQFACAVVLSYRRTRLMAILFASSLLTAFVIAALRIAQLAAEHASWLVAAGSVHNDDLMYAGGDILVLVAEGTCATVLAALTVAGVRWVLRRRHGVAGPSAAAVAGARPDTPRQASEAGPQPRPWPLRLGACALAAVIGLLVWWQPDDGAGPTILAGQPTVSDSTARAVATEQVIWFNGGGFGQFKAVGFGDLNAVITLIKDTHPGADHAVLLAQLKARCRTLTAAIPTARAFPLPPGQPLRADWVSFLAQQTPIAQSCQVLDAADDTAPSTSFLGELHEQLVKPTILIKQITAQAGDAQYAYTH